MKTLKQEQKRLQKELVSIQSKLTAEIILKHYPIIKKKYEGKCFKKENGYNSEEKWLIYIKVKKIKPDDIYDTLGNGITAYYSGYSFQTTTTSIIEIEEIRTGYVHSLGKEIPQDEFDNEWNKMIQRLNKIKK